MCLFHWNHTTFWRNERTIIKKKHRKNRPTDSCLSFIFIPLVGLQILRTILEQPSYWVLGAFVSSSSWPNMWKSVCVHHYNLGKKIVKFSDESSRTHSVCSCYSAQLHFLLCGPGWCCISLHADSLRYRITTHFTHSIESSCSFKFSGQF